MKRNYTTPRIEVISVNIERGFADSFDTTIVDYTKNGGDSLDD